MNSSPSKIYLRLAIAISVSLCCSEGIVSAQGDFGGFRVQNPLAQNPQTAPQTFQPAAIGQSLKQAASDFATEAVGRIESHPVLAQPVSAPPVLARPDATRPQLSWPDKPVKFDDLVRQTNLEQSGNPNGVNGLIGSTVDSAGQLLGSWKDKIGQKTNQLLGDGQSAAAEVGGSDWLSTIKQKANSPNVRRMLGSLALVVGGYLALVVVLRKFSGGGQQGIPSEVVSVLGNLPYGHKQQLRLVRLGSKLVLLLNGPEGTHPIGEITDPGEVEYLAALCQGKRAMRPPAAAPVFQQAAPVLQQAVEAVQPGSALRGVTEDRLTQVINRLEQATRGGTASYEA